MKGSDAKFRAWDSLKQEYVYNDFHVIGEVNAFDLINMYSIEYLINLDIEEWTGLIDMNKKLLYEGDLFQSIHDKFIHRVWKVEGGFATNPHVFMWQKDILQENPFPLLSLADEQTVSWFKSSCFIIGNIKQNPKYIDLNFITEYTKTLNK